MAPSSQSLEPPQNPGRFTCAIQQQAPQLPPFLVITNQLAHVFAAGAVASFADLLIDKRLE
jgi:hypothetical protein